MVRGLYNLLLRLHPRGFRERFGEEMRSIFDESPQKSALLMDACASLLRQQFLRPAATSSAPAAAAPLATDGAPVFHMVDNSPPRAAAMLPGALLSWGFFAIIALAVNHGGGPKWLQLGTRHPSPHLLSVDRNSIAPTDPTTHVKVGDESADPWREFAESYFRIMPVLRALDANHDYSISRDEIAKAPAALHSLDRDGDGKLSPLECGLYLGRNPETVTLKEAELLGALFLSSQPVLAALDADHDGEISAKEIATASAALRRLDISGDGVLAPAEIAAASVVARILSQSRE